MEQRKEITTAIGLVRELKHIRNQTGDAANYLFVRVQLDDVRLESEEIEKLNRRMPSIVRILDDESATYRVSSRYSTLSGIHLPRGNFSNADFSGTDLSDSALSDANFSFAPLASTNLEGARLQGANFEGAYIRRTRFCGSYRDGANFERTIPGITDYGRMDVFDYGIDAMDECSFD